MVIIEWDRDGAMVYKDDTLRRIRARANLGDVVDALAELIIRDEPGEEIVCDMTGIGLPLAQQLLERLQIRKHPEIRLRPLRVSGWSV